MPFVAPFPVDAPYGTGPKINIFVEMPEEFAGDETIYEDLGADYNEPVPTYVRRFKLIYNNKRRDEVAVLDAHYRSAHFKNYGFQFTHPKTGEIIQDVHYEIYERPDHTKDYEQERIIVLIKRPVGTT